MRDGNRSMLDITGENFVALLDRIGGDRFDPSIPFVEFKSRLWMVYPDGTELDGNPIIAAHSTLHDIRPVVGSDG